MAPPPDLSPGMDGGVTNSPGNGVSFEIQHHVARLPLENTAVCVADFGRREPPTPLENAVVAAIAEFATAERDRRRRIGTVVMDDRRPILMLVASEARAKDVHKLLSTNEWVWASIVRPLRERPNSIFEPRQEDETSVEACRIFKGRKKSHDVVIMQDWHALELFRAEHVLMSRVCMLIFDEAQKASTKANAFSTVMREFFRCQSKNERPRILAISTASDADLSKAAVEHNLYVKFPSQGRQDLNIPYVTSVCKRDSNPLADVEALFYPEDPQISNSSGFAFLVSELGPNGLSFYKNMFLMRALGAEVMRHQSEVVFHGFSPKAINLIAVLRNEFSASSEAEKLSVIVHAGQPVVAVALHAVLKSLPCFEGLVSLVVLGDEHSAKPPPGTPLVDPDEGWQGADKDKDAIDDFGCGDANVLIVASANMDRISREIRPLPPCGFVIRFDGSPHNPAKDGGGGRCRVIIFQPQVAKSGSRMQSSKRRKKNSGEAEGVRDSDAQSDDKENSGTRVRASKYLTGIAGGEASVVHLYGLRIVRKNRTQAQDMDNFGVVLKEKLGQHDLDILIQNLGLQCPVRHSSGYLQLVFMDSMQLSSKQVADVRDFTSSLFASVLPNVDKNMFHWGNNMRSSEDCEISPDGSFLRNYLVVPVVWNRIVVDERDTRSLGESSAVGESRIDNRAAIDGSGQSPKGSIDWVQISKVRAQVRNDTSGKSSERMQPEQSSSGLEEGHEKLQDNFIIHNGRTQLAGSIRMSSCETETLLTVIDPPCIDIERLADALRGAPVCGIVKKIIVETYKPILVAAKLCTLSPLPIAALFLPSFLVALERHVLLCELRDMFSEVGVPIPLRILAQALTSDEVSMWCNYERLEFLGDSLLKLCCTVRLFTGRPHFTEGQMHDGRKKIVSNEALTASAHTKELQKFLLFKRQSVRLWTPPGWDCKGRFVALKNKSLADVVESLCAVLYLSGSEHFQAGNVNTRALDSDEDSRRWPGAPLLHANAVKEGYSAAAKMLELFGVVTGPEPTPRETLMSAIHSLHPDGTPAPKEIVPQAFPREPRLARPRKPWSEQFGPLEDVLQYRFQRRHILICALTHGSYIDLGLMGGKDWMLENFQRFEFLGDAIAELCVVLYLYETYPVLGPGELTELKGLVVSNETFARVSVQFELDKYLFRKSAAMEEAITAFKELVKEEKKLGKAETIETGAAPKVLGDVFESILGAVFADAGLETAWNVGMRLLRKTLEEKADCSMLTSHPMKQLDTLVTERLQITKRRPQYVLKDISGAAVQFECSVRVVGKEIAVGTAASKKIAQINAAKKACYRLKHAKAGSADAKLIEELKMQDTKNAIEKERSSWKN